MRGKKIKSDKSANLVLSEYGKDKLLMCANSFEIMANGLGEEFSCDDTLDRQEYLYLKRNWENKKLISSNMRDMSKIMRTIVNEVYEYEPVGEKKHKQIAALMKLEKIEIKDICYLKGQAGEKSIGIYMRSTKMGGVNIEEAAGYLSYIFNMSLESSPYNEYIITEKWNKYTFTASTKYVVMTGIAKAIKEGEIQSGDNCSLFEGDGGQFNVLLSDGMGSGEQACKDSEEVLELMEQLLDTNYAIESAMGMANQILSMKHNTPNMSTLDCAAINLYTGECELRKVGGAVTFLKRTHGVEQIKGKSLPLGMDFKLDFDYRKLELMDGDFLIFFTDGAFEGIARDGEIEAENVLADIVNKINMNNAKEIAQHILQYILYMSNGWIRDDITVIVVGIWEKT